MRLYLIRHAQSENNALSAASIPERKVDPDLTPRGYQQRDIVAQHLASAIDAGGMPFAITALYTSAMYRSLLTTAPIAKALGLKPAIWPDLHEKGGLYQVSEGQTRGFGGLTRSAIARQFPNYELPDELDESGWYAPELGWEPETHSMYRAIKVARQLRSRASGDEGIALVSHAGFLDLLLKALFDQLPSRPRAMRYYHDNTAITRLNFDGPALTLHYLNRIEHVPAELRSF